MDFLKEDGDNNVTKMGDKTTVNVGSYAEDLKLFQENIDWPRFTDMLYKTDVNEARRSLYSNIGDYMTVSHLSEGVAQSFIPETMRTKFGSTLIGQAISALHKNNSFTGFNHNSEAIRNFLFASPFNKLFHGVAKQPALIAEQWIGVKIINFIATDARSYTLSDVLTTLVQAFKLDNSSFLGTFRHLMTSIGLEAKIKVKESEIAEKLNKKGISEKGSLSASGFKVKRTLELLIDEEKDEISFKFDDNLILKCSSSDALIFLIVDNVSYEAIIETISQFDKGESIVRKFENWISKQSEPDVIPDHDFNIADLDDEDAMQISDSILIMRRIFIALYAHALSKERETISSELPRLSKLSKYSFKNLATLDTDAIIPSSSEKGGFTEEEKKQMTEDAALLGIDLTTKEANEVETTVVTTPSTIDEPAVVTNDPLKNVIISPSTVFLLALQAMSVSVEGYFSLVGRCVTLLEKESFLLNMVN